MDQGRAFSAAPASASNQRRDYLKLGVPLVVSIEDARLYPRRLKHLVTVLVAVCGLATPLGSNIFLRKASLFDPPRCK